MDNLYIIGFPRSMTCRIYNCVTNSIGGNYSEVSYGEYLNIQRFSEELQNKRPFSELKGTGFFTDNESKIKMNILETLYNRKKFTVVKDVTVPQLMMDFVCKKHCNTLLIKKEVPLLAYSVIKKNWLWVTNILNKEQKENNIKINVMNSIIYTYNVVFRHILDSNYRNTEIITDELVVNNPEVFYNKLHKLGYNPIHKDYDLKDGYEKVMDYKKNELYKKLLEIYKTIEKL